MKTFFKVPTIMIHDPSLKIVGVIDNNKPKSLHFFDDEWERDLATGASVFSFSVYKKFTSDNELQRDPSSLLRKRNFVSFNYKGETFLFLIYKIKETRTMLELECRNLNLELINESALPFKSDQPLTFKQYAEKMDLLNFTKLDIGINEIASYTRTLEFSSSETKLARLLELLSKFNAEHEFRTVLNSDGTLKEFKLNVYKEYDGENYGVGKKQKNVILLGERFLTDITRTVDYDGLFTMLVPTSTQSVADEVSKSDEHGQKVTTVKNPDGSTTRTTVWTNMDGSQSKSVITTKVTKNADGSTTTVKRTEKANGSIIETTTVRTSKGNASSTTKVLKPPTSNKDTGEKELIDIASMPDWEVKNSAGEVEFYKKGEALYAPLASKLYPSTFTSETQNDQWIRKDNSYDADSSEILEQMAFKDLKLHAYPSISYEIEGWTDLDIGDRVPIQDNEFSPILIIEARVSKQKLCFTKPENSRTTYDNFKSLSSNLSADIQSRLAELVEDAKPYTIQVSTDNGTTFKNGVGESVVKAKLYKGNTLTTSDVTWRWLFNDDAKISTQYTVKASDIKETSVLTIIACVGDNEVATVEVTFTNVGDGVGVESIDRYYTTNNKSENVTVDSEEWSDEQTKMTADKKYAWSYDVTTYSDGTTKVTKPVIIGIRGDDGLDADTLEVTESLNEAKKELSGLAANVDKLKADTLAAGDEAKKQIETVANELNTAKQDLTSQAQQLQVQASAQSELTKRVSSVEETANGTKTTVSELSKTVAQNGKDITSVTARTKTVEDDLTSTKTTLSQVKTTADSTSQKTATLETGLNGVKADLITTTTTANTTKQNLANYQASNDKAVANLQSNLQTANGNISSLQTKVEAVPGQITSAISAVEGKIPSGEMNLVEYGRPADGYSPYRNAEYSTHPFYYNSAYKMYIIKNTATSEKTLGMNRFKVERNTDYTLYFKGFNNSAITHMDVWFLKRVSGSTKDFDSAQILVNGRKLSTSKAEDVSVTFNTGNYDEGYIRFDNNGSTSAGTQADLYFGDVSVKKGKSNNGWSPSQAELASSQDLKNAQSEIKQTKDGMTLLATKTELTTAKSDLQSGITTATNKANTAQNTADTAKTNAAKAQSTADSNAKTLSTHTTQISALNTGLSAKVSQTDFNTLSGRVSTAENNITAKANELSSKISSLNVGNKNYLPTSRVINRGCTNFSYNGTSKSWTMTVPASSTTFGNGITFNTSGLNILLNGGETLFFGLMIKANKACSFNYDINNYLSGTTSNDNDDRSKQAWSPSNKSIPANVWTRVWFSYTAKANVPITEANSNFGIVNNTEAITIEIKEVMVAKSNVPVDYQTPDADFEAKNTELKQTTDAISASVSTLDKSVVKANSLTINADGIVMKAGKSTTDVANAIGSYFAVNQNAINLFSDKINVKANMIVNGAVTADKIAVGAINADKISASGITADKIKGGMLQSKTNTTKFDLDSGKLFYNSNNTGIFRIQNNASTMGLKFSNTSITVNGSSHILSRVILGGDRRETTLDDSKWDQGGFSGIVVETINGVDANSHEKADALRVIADNIYFGHTYNKDVATNTSAAGWKMETFSPNSTYTGHIVLKPFGINSRYADIVTGDIRLDNGDGSGYWVRGCIQVLRNCFQHFLNGGTSANAMNAIRNALKDISGV